MCIMATHKHVTHQTYRKNDITQGKENPITPSREERKFKRTQEDVKEFFYVSISHRQMRTPMVSESRF